MKLNGNYVYVETQTELVKAYEEWSRSDILGIDIECENNLHHYDVQIALVQISSREKHWIVDIISIDDFSPVKEMLENTQILKIFHDVNFDFEILNYQFGCRPRNVFDTEIAAVLLGKEEIGLGSILNNYFNVKKEKRFQKADWTKRPLSKEMLSYAINDTTYLVNLYEVLVKELKEKNRFSWIEEEMHAIEKRKFSHRKNDVFSLKGLKNMTNGERAILKRLYVLRDNLAKKVDRPVHYIINSKKLVELAIEPPKTIGVWKSLKQVHPIVKANAEKFFFEVKKSIKETLPMPQKPKGKRFSISQRRHLEILIEMRDKVAKKINIKPHMIMNKEQMQDVVANGNNKSLKIWQKNLLRLNGDNSP